MENSNDKFSIYLYTFLLNEKLNSERTRLSKAAMTLIETLAKELNAKFEPIGEFIMHPLLKLCCKANKVYVSSAQSALSTCIEATQVTAFFIPILSNVHKSPSKTMRIAAADCLLKIVSTHPLLKLEPFLDKIEESIHHNIMDSIPEVRDLSRHLFDVYQERFASEHLKRIERFVY